MRNDDILAEYRDQILYVLGIVSALLFLPFSLNNFLQGRFWLGVATLWVVLILALNALAIHYNRPAPLSPALLFLPMLAGQIMTIQLQGITGVLWCYPCMIFWFFVLGRRQATVVNLGLLACVTPIAAVHLGFPLTARVFVTLLLTTILTSIFLSIIAHLQGRLQEMALCDPLTGAFNRRHLDRCLDIALERHRRYHVDSSLLVLDIDHFKQINDDFGHETGDRALKTITAYMQNRLRKADLLFRVGGEEFMVLLSDTGEGPAVHVAEELRRGVERLDVLSQRAVTVSIGVAGVQKGDSEVASWVRRCDGRLYRAKSQGRNQVVSGGINWG